MRYGYFDDEKREYVITRPDTPRPWSNYLGSADFGAVITNNAAGYTFYKSAAQGRLTRFRFNSIPADMPGKFVYARDAKSGDFWSNAWMPVGKPMDKFACECRFGTGYALISSEYSGIVCETTYFIPMGKLYEVWSVRVENKSKRKRSLSVYPFIEPQCNWSAADDTTNLQYNQYISRTEFVDGIIDIGSSVNMPECPERFEEKDQKRHRFFAIAGAEPSGFDGDLDKFIGTYGSYAAPSAVVSGACGNSVSAGDNPCGAFQIDIVLEPGESRSFAVLFGVGQAGTAGKTACRQMDSPAKIAKALAAVKEHWHSRLNSLKVETPDAEFDSLANTWAPYNNLMTFYWSRTASLVYAGERDGLGFRDTVQDIVGASALVMDEAGPRLELMLTGQVSTGGAMPVVKPFAHRPGHEKAPENYRSDDCLWFFNAVPEYVKETGDFGFYSKVLPYADRGEGTVFQHLRRAIEFNLERSGAHGLPCGLHADWNDCVRLGGDGETVFVAFQLRLALREYVEIAERLREKSEVNWGRGKLALLDENLEKYAWDGDWYLRAYRADGFKFGSKESGEGTIFMNPQTWAVISGHATGERAGKIMEEMHARLATEYGIMLCAPPYITSDPKIALGRLFNPGMKENSSVFNHTQGWAVMAASDLGMNGRAYEYLKAVLPSSFNERAEIRQVEPYVVCQTTHSKYSQRFGAGRVSWLSGSAVWNYYAMTHAILGIKPHYDGLQIDPCIPDAWKGFSAVRRFRGCEFRISVEKRCKGKGRALLKINGETIGGNIIPAAKFAETNEVEVELV